MNDLKETLKSLKEQGSPEWDQDFFIKSIIPILNDIINNVIVVFDDIECEEKQITPTWRGIQFDFYNGFDSLEIEFFVQENNEYVVEYLIELYPNSIEKKYIGGRFIWVDADNTKIVKIINVFICGSYL